MTIAKAITTGVAGLTLAGGGVAITDTSINPYTDLSDHYELPVSGDLNSGSKIEVMKTTPSIVLDEWNGESRIQIVPKLPGAGRASNANRPLLSKRMQFTKGNITAFVEPTASSSAFAIDFSLAAKPTTNVFSYTISNPEDLDFFYQDALNAENTDPSLTCTATECSDDSGTVVERRPENVVGSYAVYSKTKRNHIEGQTDYGTGKLFHIYRPQASDAAGNTTWADLHYQDGILTVTVPQKFLDAATYPVIVDPDFGYTTAGGSAQGLNAGIFSSNKAGYSPVSNGTLTSMNINVTGSSISTNFQTAVYLLGGAGTLIDDTGSQTVAIGAAKQWYTIPTLLGGTVSSASTYYVAAQATSNFTGVSFDSVAGDGRQNASTASFGTWPSTITSWTDFVDSRKLSIYATYTAAAPPNNSVQMNIGASTVNVGNATVFIP